MKRLVGCPVCKGTGIVKFYRGFWRWLLRVPKETITCPVCRGTGDLDYEGWHQ